MLIQVPVSGRSGVIQLLFTRGDFHMHISEPGVRLPGKVDDSSDVTFDDNNIKINIKVTGRGLNLE